MHEALTVLVLGDHDHIDFEEPIGWLRQHCDCRCGPLVEDICLSMASDLLPHTIVFAQARPGTYSASAVAAICDASPQSHFAALLGSWCEGEMRSGKPWPGIERFYWHQWRELTDQLSGTVAVPGWWAPEAGCAQQETNPSDVRGTVAIGTARPGTFDALADACTAVGYGSVWVPDVRTIRIKNPTAAIFDAERNDDASFAGLARFAKAMAPAPSIAVLGFPRAIDHALALRIGAAGVISKPLDVDHLLHELERLTNTTAEEVALRSTAA